MATPGRKPIPTDPVEWAAYFSDKLTKLVSSAPVGVVLNLGLWARAPLSANRYGVIINFNTSGEVISIDMQYQGGLVVDPNQQATDKVDIITKVLQ